MSIIKMTFDADGEAKTFSTTGFYLDHATNSGRFTAADDPECAKLADICQAGQEGDVDIDGRCGRIRLTGANPANRIVEFDIMRGLT